MPEEQGNPCMWRMLRRFVAAVTPFSSDSKLAQEFLSKPQLLAEVDRLEQELGECGERVVFCHNDLQMGNVILQPGGEAM